MIVAHCNGGYSRNTAAAATANRSSPNHRRPNQNAGNAPHATNTA